MKRNKMKNRARKLISMVLATAILPCLFVSTAHAKEDKAMQYVDGNLDSLQVETGDLVYFGQDDDELSFDTCWQVLDAKQTNTGEDGMFLMTKNLVAYQDEKGILFEDTDNPVGNEYRGSTIQKFCGEFAETHFSDAENAAVIATSKSDAEFKTPVFFQGKNTTVNFDPAEGILDNDKVFLLSAEEVNNPEYGFTGDESRIATFNGVDSNWWLRSPHDYKFPLDVGFVFANGWQADLYVNGFSMLHTPYTARLALNLDASQILFATSVDAGSDMEAEIGMLEEVGTAETSQWKLTVKDEKRNEFQASRIFHLFGFCAIHFEGAETGENERVSAVIINDSGEVTYYGTVAKNKTDGFLLLNLQDKYDDGDTLYLFSENAADGTSTNYAGGLSKVL